MRHPLFAPIQRSRHPHTCNRFNDYWANVDTNVMSDRRSDISLIDDN